MKQKALRWVSSGQDFIDDALISRDCCGNYVSEVQQLFFAPKSAILYSIMTTLYSDTDSKAERLQIELLRHAPAWRKIQMVARLNETVGTLALSGPRKRHPDASSQVLHRLLADLMLGESLAERVYGPIQKH